MRAFRAQLFCFLSVLLCAILVLGCRPPPRPVLTDESDLPKKIKGASDRRSVKQRNQLNAKCIKVISMGQDYLININSAAIFAKNSPRLLAEGYPILDEVVAYLRNFRIVELHVASYATPYVSPKRTESLTDARAREVADYLGYQGVDSRLIVSDGEGSRFPITACCANGTSSSNDRVELTFRHVLL